MRSERIYVFFLFAGLRKEFGGPKVRCLSVCLSGCWVSSIMWTFASNAVLWVYAQNTWQWQHRTTSCAPPRWRRSRLARPTAAHTRQPRIPLHAVCWAGPSVRLSVCLRPNHWPPTTPESCQVRPTSRKPRPGCPGRGRPLT